MILAGSLVALYQAFSTGASGVTSLDQHLSARILAQSLLDSQVSDRVLKSGTTEGQSEGLQWSISVAQSEPTDPRGGPDQWRLYSISVTVLYGMRKRVRLDTLRLGRPS